MRQKKCHRCKGELDGFELENNNVECFCCGRDVAFCRFCSRGML